GDKDWLQLSTRDYTDYAKKASGVSAITNFTHLDPSYRELAGDTQFTYTYTDAAAGTQPGNNKAIVAKSVGNGFSFNLPSGKTAQKITFGVSMYRATARAELLINGATYYSGTVTANVSSGLPLSSSKIFEINYIAPNPTDVVEVRVILTESFASGTGGSLCLSFVALSANGSVGQTISTNAEKFADTAKGSYKIYNASDETLDALCILAEYNADGQLVNLSRKTIRVDAWCSDVAEIVSPSTRPGGTTRAFIWDAKTLVPLCEISEHSLT
ncbi:MAG: hypothetical protein LBK75_04895, partial [Oscillospiraceae bacterium]|nr:hypothetical protein [Oscillospiraceae bacterium]